MKGIDGFLRNCNVKQGATLVCGSKIHEGTDKPDRRTLYAGALGMDMLDGDGVDIVHDLEKPIPDSIGPFDHVDCVSTLEHVRRPWLFAANVEAAMTPGATILVLIPWVWREHAYPDDFWRMTPSAVASLFPSITWDRQAYIVEDRLRKGVPKLTALGCRWLARSELVMFGRKCASTS